ncbi:MAG: PAS domain S-box protein [Rhodocyclaceae bacterium]|nr:PAS domain S-box protein [Rhodocyclaceae bacterium]
MPALHKSKPSRVLVALWLLFSLGTLVTTVTTMWRLKFEVIAHQLNQASVQAQAFDDALVQPLTLIDLSGHDIDDDLDRDNPERLATKLAQVLQHAPFVRSLSLATPDGRIFASSNAANIDHMLDLQSPQPEASAASDGLRIGMPWQGRDFAEGRPTSPEQPAAADQSGFVPVLRKLPTRRAPVILAAALNPDYFINLYARQISPVQGRVDVVRLDNVLLFSTRDDFAPGSRYDATLVASGEHAQESGTRTGDGKDGVPVLTAYRVSRNFPLVTVVHINQNFALAKWLAETRTVASVVTVGLTLLSVLAAILLRRLRRSERIEADTEAQTRLAAQVFESAGEGILITDARSVVLRINSAFANMSGFSTQDLVGKKTSVLSSGRHDEAFYAAMWKCIKAQGIWRGEIVNRRKDGKLQTEWLTISAVRDELGRVSHYVGIYADISERRRVEEELREHRDHLRELVDARTAELLTAKDTAEAANRAKSEFLSNMSHELRTPMHAILAFAQLGSHKSSLDTSGAGKLRTYFANIEQAGRRLMGLLDDLLDLSKLEAGRMQLDIKFHPLRPLVQEVSAELAMLIDERKQTLTLTAEDDAAGAYFDRARTAQVLRNLLGNACKFAPKASSIEIRYGQIEAGMVYVSIKDVGPGIAPEDIERIFEKFEQGTATKAFGKGSGLGLAICREIVLGQGGQIWAGNNPEGGAHFTFTLHANNPSQAQLSATNESRQPTA